MALRELTHVVAGQPNLLWLNLVVLPVRYSFSRSARFSFFVLKVVVAGPFQRQMVFLSLLPTNGGLR